MEDRMRKMLLSLGAAAMLVAGGMGCAHEMHQARADYHHDRAREDARHMNLGHAIHEQHEANVEQRRADDARW
jgi:hypothetical protein